MGDLNKFVLTAKHKVSLADASDPFPTITVYGKVIEKVSLTPSTGGITHPRGGTDDLHAGLVYGYSFAGSCTKLATPQQVLLPHPDGEADSCGWEPNEFVVWKNIPKDWETLHIQTQAKPLAEAVALTVPPPAQTPLYDSIDVVSEWCGIFPKWKCKLEDLCHNRYPDWKPTAAGAGTPSTPGTGSIMLASMLSAKNRGRYTGTIDQKLLLGLADPTVTGLFNELRW